VTSPISSTSSDPFKDKTKQEIRELTGQDEGDFFQNSIEIDFSTGLYGDKDNLISNHIIKEIQDNQLPFTVRNKQENISVLVANLFKIHILNCRPYSRTYMDANEFTEIRSNSYFNIGYQGWANTVRIFEKLGYLTIFPGGYFEVQQTGYLTKLKISDKFKELVNKFDLTYQDILKRTPPISLKDSKDNEIKVINSKTTNPIRKRLERYNNLILSSDIELPIDKIDYKKRKSTGFANRTYTKHYLDRSYKSGGKYYSPCWQNLSKELRKEIKINGQETVELDFNAMHLHLLYCKVNKKLTNYIPEGTDAYQLPNRNRKIVKTSFTCCINNNCNKDNVNQVVGPKVAQKFPEIFVKNTSYRDILEELGSHHPEVSQFFYAQIGNEVSNMESKVSDYIIGKLSRKNILALNIHDSFIVSIPYKDILLNTMIDAFKYLKYSSIPRVSQ
jgi:hypothetical protein